MAINTIFQTCSLAEIDAKLAKLKTDITGSGTGDTLSGLKKAVEKAQNDATSAGSAAAKAQEKANQAYTLAEGRSRSASYATIAAMQTALEGANNSQFKVGDNIFIEAVDVPDFWISKVNATKGTDKVPASGSFNSTYNVGYYTISKLETQKVDLSSYALKSYVDQKVEGNASIIGIEFTANNTIKLNFKKNGTATSVETGALTTTLAKKADLDTFKTSTTTNFTNVNNKITANTKKIDTNTTNILNNRNDIDNLMTNKAEISFEDGLTTNGIINFAFQN